MHTLLLFRLYNDRTLSLPRSLTVIDMDAASEFDVVRGHAMRPLIGYTRAILPPEILLAYHENPVPMPAGGDFLPWSVISPAWDVWQMGLTMLELALGTEYINTAVRNI